MAEGDGAIYNGFKTALMNGEIDLVTMAIKVVLVAAYTPDIDTHVDFGDVEAKEVTGAGYTHLGEEVGGRAVTQDSVNDLAKFDGTDLTWTGLNVGTPSHAVMYDGSGSTGTLIAYWELATASNGGNYTLQWHEDGILTLS